MKVAISIPDRVFRAAERVSKRMRISRSQLYAKAVEAYIQSLSGEEITEQLNRVYEKTSSRPEPGLEAATLEVLRRERWE
jgi:metal-responsive CopG/Arc/MetJ family transcriptional regulator